MRSGVSQGNLRGAHCADESRLQLLRLAGFRTRTRECRGRVGAMTVPERSRRAGILSVVFATAITFADNPAPHFRLDDTEGKTFDLKEHTGKDVVLLDFWATFCVPC